MGFSLTGNYTSDSPYTLNTSSTASSTSSTDWSGISKGISGLFGAFNTFAQGYSKSQAYQIQGDYQQRVSEVNTTIADMEADQAVAIGEKNANQYASKVRQKVGDERAGLASQGIDVNTGTAYDVQEDTKFFGDLDVQTIKNNAYMQAFGYKMQSIGASAAGQFAGISANLNSNSSLIGGGLSAVGGLAKTGYDFFGK